MLVFCYHPLLCLQSCPILPFTWSDDTNLNEPCPIFITLVTNILLQKECDALLAWCVTDFHVPLPREYLCIHRKDSVPRISTLQQLINVQFILTIFKKRFYCIHIKIHIFFKLQNNTILLRLSIELLFLLFGTTITYCLSFS